VIVGGPANRHALLAVLVSAVVLVAADAGAQTSPRQQAADLAAQLMSPFCPGRLLVDCTSSQAYDLRDAIANRLGAGESVDAVRADLVRQYGTAILGAPAAEGVGVLAWLLPALLGMATLGGVVWKIVRATSGPATPLVAAPAGDAALLSRLDDELRDLD
jgi:cytochrome c-type biogenesis protein CcmH